MTREEAIYILKEIEYPTNGDNKKERDIAFDMAIKALEQEPETQRWIEYIEPDDAEPLVLWRCENCDTVERRKTPYCPCCGAMMEVKG